jgi:hypothetical protein
MGPYYARWRPGKLHTLVGRNLLHLIALSSASSVAEPAEDSSVEATSINNVGLDQRAAVKAAEQEPGESTRGRWFF